MSLINDILIKTGIIKDIGVTNNIEWFKNVTYIDFICIYVFPIMFFIAFAIYLRDRYNIKKERDEITLRRFIKK